MTRQAVKSVRRKWRLGGLVHLRGVTNGQTAGLEVLINKVLPSESEAVSMALAYSCLSAT